MMLLSLLFICCSIPGWWTNASLLTLESSGDDTDKVIQLVRNKAEAATVKIVNVSDERQGSGVIIRRDRVHLYILTANHVVVGAKRLELHIRTGKGKSTVFRSATVLGGSADLDLAVIRLSSSSEFPEALPVCERGKGPRGGGFVAVSVGWTKSEASAQDETVKRRVQLRRPGGKDAVLSFETQRKPANGRSGGPLIDPSGSILGIASGHDSEFGYYTHFDEIHRFLRENGLQWLFEKDR